MGLRTDRTVAGKKKNRAPEALQPDDAQATRHVSKHEEVRRRAYEIYLSREATGGQELADWLEAEHDLL